METRFPFLRAPARVLRTALLLALAPLAAACEQARETAREYGIGVLETPDEFAVIQNDPLELPENLDESEALPAPGTLDPTSIAASPAVEEAETILRNAAAANGPGTSESAAVSRAERQLLRAVGADGESETIRQTLVADRAGEGGSLGERILFWQNSDSDLYPVIDPVAEAERINRILSEGKTPTGEGVPVQEDPGLSF